MEKKIFYILLYLITAIQVGLAQHPVYWSLTTEDGLPTNEVYDLYQDSKGYMWIATDKGLCRYDGNHFKYYKNKAQKGTSVSHFQEMADGRIWLMSFRNEIFYIENDSLHYFEPLDDYEAKKITNYLIDQSNRLWLIDRKSSLSYYDLNKKEWHTVPLAKVPDRNIDITANSLVETVDGQLYVMTGVTINYLDGDIFKSIPIDTLIQNVPQNIRHDRDYKGSKSLDGSFVTRLGNQIYVKQIGRYIGLMPLNNSKLSYLEGHKKEYEYLIKQDNPQVNLRYTSRRDVWCMSQSDGAFCLFNEDSTQNKYAGMHLFPGEAISDILIDHEGNYWISTLNKGIHVIPSIDLIQYNKDNSFFDQNQLGLLTHTKGSLFVGDDNGSIYQMDYTNQQLRQKYSILGRRLFFLGETNTGTLHFGGGEGVGKLIPNVYGKMDYIEMANALFGINPKAISVYKDSILFMARGDIGLYAHINDIKHALVDASIFPSMLFSFSIDSTRISRKLEIATHNLLMDEPHDRIWALGKDGIIVIPEYLDTIFHVLDKDGQKIINTLDIIKTSDGLVWVTTVSKGIYCFNANLEMIKHLDVEDGLISNGITAIIESSDQQGLWLLSNKGIQYWGLYQQSEHKYTLDDGLPSLEIRDMEVLNGQVYITTEKGLVSFSETMNSKNRVAPKTYITKVSINDQDTILHRHYDLDYTQNYLAIYADGISFRNQGAFLYEFRMLGTDTIWRTQNSVVNYMRFPVLTPGDYTFEVRSINADGVKGTIDSITFTIHPPYWQTWWFQGGIYLIILLIVVGFIIRRNQIQRQDQERKNAFNVLKMQALQSQMNPHFVFNVLTAIQNLWMQKKNEPALQMQSTFAKLLRKIFQYSSRRSITIEEEEAFLNNYLNLEQIRFERSVEIHFEIEDELLDDEYCIPPLLIQPIIENSFKHGLFHKKSAKQLTITLKKEMVYLYCLVEDNGVGRSVNKNANAPKRRTSGLTTTRDRLTILQENVIGEQHPDDNFKITDLKDAEGNALGTRVEIWIPFVESE